MNPVPVLTQKIGSKKKNKSLKPIQCASEPYIPVYLYILNCYLMPEF